MLSRLLLPTLLLLAVFGLAACAVSNDHRSGGQCRRGDACCTLQDPGSFLPLKKRFARDKARGHCLGGDFARDAQSGHAPVEISGNHGPTCANIDECDTADAGDAATGDRGHNGYHGDPESARPDATGKPRRTVRTLRGTQLVAVCVFGRNDAADACRLWDQGQAVVGADAATFAFDPSDAGAAQADDSWGARSVGRRVVVSK